MDLFSNRACDHSDGDISVMGAISCCGALAASSKSSPGDAKGVSTVVNGASSVA